MKWGILLALAGIPTFGGCGGSVEAPSSSSTGAGTGGREGTSGGSETTTGGTGATGGFESSGEGGATSGGATSGGGAESTGGASSGGTTSGGTTSGSSGSGGGTPPSKACQSCAQNAVDSQCASAHTQCTGDFACNQLLECHGDCDWTTQCNQMCDAIIPSGVPLFEALITCIACDVCGAPCAGSTVAAYCGP